MGTPSDNREKANLTINKLSAEKINVATNSSKSESLFRSVSKRSLN